MTEAAPPTCTDVLAAVRDLCERLDPATVPGPQVAQVFEAFVAMRRLVDGAVTRLGPRYERTGAWKDNGATSAAEHLARATGTSPADSKRRLRAGRSLERLGELDRAVRTGAVSSEQAEIISTAADDGDSESELIEVAKRSSHRELRDEAARQRAKAETDQAARQARQRRLRSVSRWTDEDGMYNLHLRTIPEVGAEIDARLKPLVDDAFATARREGRREPVPAYVADVAADLLTGDGAAGPARSSGQAVRPERKVIAIVDIEALNRGHTEGDERCELAGVGPVSVAAVRALFGDAAVAAVFRDAVDIRSVVHLGRQVNAIQRTALEARGPRCGVVDCRSTHELEIDHTKGWSYTQVTEVDDLEWLCNADHRLKTQRNLLALGPPGHRILVERDPDDPTKPKLPLVQVRPVPVPVTDVPERVLVGAGVGDRSGGDDDPGPLALFPT